MNDEPDPVWNALGVPICRESCAQHDGKRCQLMGFRPCRICEPAVERMATKLKLAEVEQ